MPDVRPHFEMLKVERIITLDIHSGDRELSDTFIWRTSASYQTLIALRKLADSAIRTWWWSPGYQGVSGTVLRSGAPPSARCSIRTITRWSARMPELNIKSINLLGASRQDRLIADDMLATGGT